MVLCAEVGKVECLCAEEVSFLKSLINFLPITWDFPPEVNSIT